jgi:hypothetical protein
VVSWCCTATAAAAAEVQQSQQRLFRVLESPSKVSQRKLLAVAS